MGKLNQMLSKAFLILNNNIYLSVILFSFLCLKVVLLFRGMGANFICLDGWYYSNIARSIIEGHGYANPFGVDTGPTAWVPPFLVFVFIPIFKFIGDNSVGFLVIDIIQMLGFSISFYFLLETWQLISIRKFNLILFFVFSFFIYLNQLVVFRQITDLWNTLLIISISLYGLLNFYKNGKSFWLLSILAAFIPLTAPTIAPWFSITLIFLFLSDLRLMYYSNLPKTYKNRYAKILVIGFIFSISLSTWTVRNYNVFNKIIWSKSNIWFEFYLANIKDDDGILSLSTIKKFHPDANQEKFRDEIKQINEVKWLDKYDSISHIYLKEHRNEYNHKVLNRIKNSFLFMDVTNDVCESNILNKISIDSKDSLEKYSLIKEGYWVCLNSDSIDIKNTMSTIVPADFRIIFTDWTNCKTKIYTKTLIDNLYSYFIALVPFLCLILLISLYYKKEFSFIFIVSSLYFIYLIPYILISHELRYQQPLFGVQVLFISLVLSILTKMLLNIKIIAKYTDLREKP